MSSNEKIIKRFNNVKSLDFLITIKLNIEEFDDNIHQTISNWLINYSLDKIDHPSIYEKDYLNVDDQQKKYAWRIVTNILNKDFLDDDNNLRNEIWFAIHLDIQPKLLFEKNIFDKEEIIVINENIELELMSPEFIMKHLRDIPNYVASIGISGVSQKFMKEIWYEICSEGTFMDGDCQGLMSHPMWVKNDENQWVTKPECSNKFGWENYPPDNNIFPFPKLF